MSKFSRRRFSPASFRGATLASLLIASLVGFVGCSGGANPFCCDSKEKERLDNLERAQSADENAKNDASEQDAEESSDETQEKSKGTVHAGLDGTIGSGDATTIAGSEKPAQQVPVTASAEAVASNALQDAESSSASASVADALPVAQTPVDANALLPAPELAPATPPSPPVDETNATSAPENADAPLNAASEEAPVDETPAPNVESDDASNDAESPASSSAPAPSPDQETENAATETSESSEKPATPPTVARSARRNGPQRAASSRVAQRATRQTLAVPETRGVATVATFSAASDGAPSFANVVKVRAQTTASTSGSQTGAASRPEILSSLGAQTPSNVVKIRKRTLVP